MFFENFNFLGGILKKNNFFYMVTRKPPMKNTLYSTCMQHEMPQSLLVFTVSLTSETHNFGTFGGVAHPP